MPKSSKPSRAEARARRFDRDAAIPARRVYGLTVEDPMAQTWQSQVILFTTSPEQAHATFQEAGFFKRTSSEIDAKQLPVEDVSFAEKRLGQIFLRRGHDFGWSRWYPLPPGYVHPPTSVAARDASAGRLPGEPERPADEFSSPRWKPSALRRGYGINDSDSDS